MSDREFKVGDLVYLKIQPYRQKYVVNRSCLKLETKYFGPYKVLERIGNVAYKLEFLSNAKVHQVFHVSQLKKHISSDCAQSTLLILGSNGTFVRELVAILDRRMKNVKVS